MMTDDEALSRARLTNQRPVGPTSGGPRRGGPGLTLGVGRGNARELGQTPGRD